MDDERFCNHTVASFILGLGLSAATPPGSLSGRLLKTDSGEILSQQKYSGLYSSPR